MILFEILINYIYKVMVAASRINENNITLPSVFNANILNLSEIVSQLRHGNDDIDSQQIDPLLYKQVL